MLVDWWMELVDIQSEGPLDRELPDLERDLNLLCIALSMDLAFFILHNQRNNTRKQERHDNNEISGKRKINRACGDPTKPPPSFS